MCQCPGRVIITRPCCPCSAATVVLGTSKLFARTLSSSIVRHKLIIKKRNSCVDQTELFCHLYWCVILGTHHTPWCLAHSWVSAQQYLWAPAKNLVLGCSCQPLLLGLQGEAGPTDGSGACVGLTPGPVVVALPCRRVHGQLAEGSRSAMAECTLICSENGL